MSMQLVGVCVLFVFIHTFAGVFALWLTGVGIREITFGMGPPLFQWKKLKVNLLPLMGSVSYVCSENEDKYVDPAVDFNCKPLFFRGFVVLSGCIMTFFIALLADWDVALASFGSAYYQLFTGAISPLDSAQTYLDAFAGSDKSPTSAYFVAVVFPKIVAFQLLPLPILSGGGLVFMAITRWFGSSSTVWKIYSQMAMITFSLYFSWLLALGNFWYRHTVL